MSDTPRTDAATRMAFSGEYMVPIQESQKLERELTDMRERSRELIPLIPTAYCEMFHHEKKDQHAYDEECKPLSRYNAKIQKAKEALGL